MPNHIKEATSEESTQRILAFLKEQPVGVLATVDENNEPHATVIYFAIQDDFAVTFTTKRDTKKHSVLQKNNNVMLVAYDAQSQTTVQVAGTAHDITDEPDAFQVFRHTVEASMKTSEAGIPPISRLQAGHYVAYRIDPKQIRMAMFIRPDAGGYDMYETIDFDV